MGVVVYDEDDLLPISALQHLLFCPRQCALIHVERLWAENSLTLEGRHLHEKADAGKGESRKRNVRSGLGPAAQSSLRISRGLMLRSLQLGLYGKADVVEFLAAPTGPEAAPNCPPGDMAQRGAAIPFPVEYKRGKPKKNRCDEVQLCAQALCLEEMLGMPVPDGALFYGTTRRRMDVAFDEPLRSLTRRLIGQLREMVDTSRTPPAVREKKCERCSLLHLCLPEARPGTDAASRYLRRAVRQALAELPADE
ncbi:MAG TPA: CRISPR-associated protein Cas4 [Tepidisphaeraceae bacterium]|jgi:CRISPR-associated exonuclease Cas4|nr:CRISPR-associated protein Cas4 [Tepidisphaeraceae bacterium]